MNPTKQNLVFYISHLNYGGAEKALLCLIPYLTSFYKITLITDIYDSILYDQFKALESIDFELVHVAYPFRGNKIFRTFSLVSKFIGICINRRTHYFISLFLSNSYMLLIFKLLSRKTKIVIWEHTIVSKHYPSRYPLLSFFFLADRILLPSIICKVDFLSLYPSLQSKVSILPNPFTLDLSLLSVDNYKSSSPYGKIQPLNLLVIGRLSIEKNVSTAISCVKNLCDLNYSPILEIYGSGDELSKLKRLASSLCLNTRITFFDFSSNCWENVQHNSIVLITSDYESFSMVALEALCLGHFVVSTPEANSHIFEDHPNFFVSRSSSVFDVSSCIIDVYETTRSDKDFDYGLIEKFSPHTIATSFSLLLP